MKAVIVFHSVCGNGYLVARKFLQELTASGFGTALYRVADPAWVDKPDVPSGARENLMEMRRLPEVTPDVLLEADVIIMGSPTYFGNVSAQMKAFMDATGGLWVKGALAGRRFAAFTSAGHDQGGGVLCLQALHAYGQYMGMLSVPVPVTVVPGENVCTLGVVQYSNGKYGEMLDPKTERTVAGFSRYLARRS